MIPPSSSILGVSNLLNGLVASKGYHNKVVHTALRWKSLTKVALKSPQFFCSCHNPLSQEPIHLQTGNKNDKKVH